MKININTNEVFYSIPKNYGDVFGYNRLSDEQHYNDGFRTLIYPELKIDEKIGELFFNQDDDTYEYFVVDKEDYEIENQPNLASKYCDEIGIEYGRDIDIQIDHIEAFKPTEKVYNLLGQPQSKEYYVDDICVCRLEYEKVYEDKSFSGFTTTEFVGTRTVFKFYKDENKQYFNTKTKITKQFNLTPTVITEDDVATGVIWSSPDREGLLRNERYKSEQVMKSFNPNLYQLFVSIWNDEYQIYKETGVNVDLVTTISTYELDALDGEVRDENKVVIFGELEQYPPLTIRQLIIMALP